MRIEMDDKEEDYKRVVHHDGVRTTMCRNRFEVVAVPGGEIWEQQTVQMLRDWVRWRKAQEDV
jgi:hypothetical protein